MTLDIYGVITDGKLKISEKELLEQWATTLTDGQQIHVKFTPTKSIRVLKQNNLMWYLYKRIGDYIGEHKEDLHAYFKSKFLPQRIVEVNNEQIYECGSTAVLTTREMSEYLFKVNKWAIDHIEQDMLTFDEKTFLKE